MWRESRLSQVYDEQIAERSTATRLAALLLAAAAILVPWTIILGANLHGQTNVRMWSSTWVGLDIFEIAGLVATAVLLLRRHALVVVSATFAGTLFLLDAWFDVMLAQGGQPWYQALAAALFAELPLALVCFGIALGAAGSVRR